MICLIIVIVTNIRPLEIRLKNCMELIKNINNIHCPIQLDNSSSILPMSWNITTIITRIPSPPSLSPLYRVLQFLLVGRHFQKDLEVVS